MNKKQIELLKQHLNDILLNNKKNDNTKQGFIWVKESDFSEINVDLSYSDIKFILECIEFRESKQDYTII